MKIFFFFLNLENLNFSKELKILDFFFLKKFGNPEFFWKNWKFWLMIFFLSNLRSTSLMPLVLRPFLKISFLFFFFFFGWNMKICSLSKSEEDEDENGVKVMKNYSRWFFLKKPILWMRTTLAGSWCGLLDKSLLNSCKKIISISNRFIHWNELEVLTQCP